MLEKPVSGRIFFEQTLHDNLDAGRPDRVSLVFNRRIIRRGPRATPGRFRNRVVTDAVAAEASSEASAQTAWGGFSKLDHDLPDRSPAVSQAAMSWWSAYCSYQEALPAYALWGTAATVVGASEAAVFGAEWLESKLLGN